MKENTNVLKCRTKASEVDGISLTYESVSVTEYTQDCVAALGEFMGMIITGIYKSIRKGDFDVPSDFEEVYGRTHKSTLEMIREYKD